MYKRKSSWSKLVSTRRSTALSLPFPLGFPASIFPTNIVLDLNYIQQQTLKSLLPRVLNYAQIKFCCTNRRSVSPNYFYIWVFFCLLNYFMLNKILWSCLQTIYLPLCASCTGARPPHPLSLCPSKRKDFTFSPSVFYRQTEKQTGLPNSQAWRRTDKQADWQTDGQIYRWTDNGWRGLRDQKRGTFYNIYNFVYCCHRYIW